MEFATIKRIYLTLLMLNTLAASFVWGINTLFLLDAGLDISEAFTANAFFALGMMLFEIPTGVFADMWGRKLSYLLGAFTLAIASAFYVWMWHLRAPFWQWVAVKLFLGLGFAFFSGTFEAWLVDAVKASNMPGKLKSVFVHAQIVEGAAMLVGSLAGGVIAQRFNLGIPYLLRMIAFSLVFTIAFFLMKDTGFKPGNRRGFIAGINNVWTNSITYGLAKRPIRWIMISTIFTNGVMIYAANAMQPYLLQLYGDEKAYSIAGLAAAIMAIAQIVGGLLTPYLKVVFRKRTLAMFVAILLSAVVLLLIGWMPSFWKVLFLLILFSLLVASIKPMRQFYLNGLIPSDQRATVLSFDSLMGSSGASSIQPFLGQTAESWGYPASFLLAGGFQLLALPFIYLAKRARAPSD